MFLRHIKYDRSISQLELIMNLWKRFSREVIFFDMCVSYLEMCSKEIQEQTLECFVLQLWDDIEDVSASEGYRWQIAVSLHLERLCRRESIDAAVDKLNKSFSSESVFEEDSISEISTEGGTAETLYKLGSSSGAFGVYL